MKVVQKPAAVTEDVTGAIDSVMTEVTGRSANGSVSGAGSPYGTTGGSGYAGKGDSGGSVYAGKGATGGNGYGGKGDSGGSGGKQNNGAYDNRQSQYQRRAAQNTPQRTRWGGYDALEPQYKPRPKRKVESFPFDPNTVSIEDLVRLGLSEKQAESIDNYRSKGGRFRTKADFKKMYVVSDSLFHRLEPFIDIPKVELNTADSTALVSLRGIGPFYAREIIGYRERLGGYYSPEQLLEVYGMDEERFAPLRECVTADSSLIRRINLWDLPEDSLSRHPYVGRSTARSIVRYKKVCDTASWTLEGLFRENILDSTTLVKLKHYVGM